MEKHQLDRREKIATGIVLASVGAVALWAKKDGRIGVARSYPGGSFFIDVIKDAKNEVSVRMAFVLKSLQPLKIEFGDSEHSDYELDELEETFEESFTNSKTE